MDFKIHSPNIQKGALTLDRTQQNDYGNFMKKKLNVRNIAIVY